MEEKEVQGAPVHKRRVRYSGTHPKRFEEKYKELVEEGDGFEEDIDEYTSEGIFLRFCKKRAGVKLRQKHILRKLAQLLMRQ